MRFRINRVSHEEFWKYHRGSRGRLARVPGSKKVVFQVTVVAPTKDGTIWLNVRRPTRAAALRVAREVLGVSEERWARMLLWYDQDLHQSRAVRAEQKRKFEARKLKQKVREGERAKRALGKVK